MRHWRVPHGFSDLEAFAASNIAVDVGSLCTPSGTHPALLRRMLALPMRLVFCEKPLSIGPDAGRAIAADYTHARRPLAVNYTRRWNRTFVGLRDDIAAARWGQLLSATGMYSKGVLNNGSHMIDLMRFLVGELEPVAVAGRRVDWSADDPTVDAVLRTAAGAAVHLAAGDARRWCSSAPSCRSRTRVRGSVSVPRRPTPPASASSVRRKKPKPPGASSSRMR